MASLIKREFTKLTLDGNSYLTWALDVEIYLTSKELSDTIVADSESTDAQKAQTLIFLRHHLNQDLKNEYLTEKNPLVLWNSLKDRFDQQSAIVLPQAQFDWLNLRFQDYKSITEYNSALHKIVSQLKLCGQEITNTDLIEKTLSTFHATKLVLQQQYKAKNYEKHSELISTLLVAEKHNQLLMKNHNIRPAGSAPVPEAHNVAQSSNQQRGRGRSRGRGRWRGRGGRGRGNNDGKQNKNCGSSNSSGQNPSQKQVCYRCGCEGHWSRTCRTPKHLVEAYQRLKKDKGKQQTKGEAHHANLPEANAVLNDDLLKYELEDYGDQV